MNNLHICLNEFCYEILFLKQFSTLNTLNKIDNMYVTNLHAHSSQYDEKIFEKIN